MRSWVASVSSSKVCTRAFAPSTSFSIPPANSFRVRDAMVVMLPFPRMPLFTADARWNSAEPLFTAQNTHFTPLYGASGARYKLKHWDRILDDASSEHDQAGLDPTGGIL